MSEKILKTDDNYDVRFHGEIRPLRSLTRDELLELCVAFRYMLASRDKDINTLFDLAESRRSWWDKAWSRARFAFHENFG